MPATKIIWSESTRETSAEHHPTFVMICDEANLKKYRKDAGSVALVDVLETFDVWYYRHGNEGKMDRPPKDLLKQYFNTTNETQIAEFILKNGHPQHLQHDPKNPSRGNDLKNPAHGHGQLLH